MGKMLTDDLPKVTNGDYVSQVTPSTSFLDLRQSILDTFSGARLVDHGNNMFLITPEKPTREIITAVGESGFCVRTDAKDQDKSTQHYQPK